MQLALEAGALGQIQMGSLLYYDGTHLCVCGSAYVDNIPTHPLTISLPQASQEVLNYLPRVIWRLDDWVRGQVKLTEMDFGAGLESQLLQATGRARMLAGIMESALDDFTQDVTVNDFDTALVTEIRDDLRTIQNTVHQAIRVQGAVKSLTARYGKRHHFAG